MKEIITYSLSDEKDSDRYYNDVSLFADEFLAEARYLALPIIDAYSRYAAGRKYEARTSEEEYLFEFLMLGIFWNTYSGDACNLKEIPGQFLSALSQFRQRGGYLKPGIDFLKGIFSTIFLSPDLYDNMHVLEPCHDNLTKLIHWLSATGEFNQEVGRLKHWQDFFVAMEPRAAADYIATAVTLAAWFEIRSEECLGKYTINVDNFLSNVRPSHYWCEDVIFSGRRRAEYHMNMVGAEVMNRVFRDEFLKTGSKAVLLPSCMREKPDGQCRAKECSNGLKCMLCSRSCRVSQLTSLGKNNGFDVFIVTHESNAFSGRGRDGTDNQTVGIVGVACVLNLISGGWKAKSLGLPAQCVLLDYCGCKKHWHESGIVTDINVNQLKRILEIR